MGIQHLKFTGGKDIGIKSNLVKYQISKNEGDRDQMFPNLDISIEYKAHPSIFC